MSRAAQTSTKDRFCGAVRVDAEANPTVARADKKIDVKRMIDSGLGDCCVKKSETNGAGRGGRERRDVFYRLLKEGRD